MTGGLAVPESKAATESETESVPVKARPAAIAVLATVPVLVVLIDQLSKELALNYLTGEPPLRLLWGAVYLNLTRNSGAAFSLGSDYTFVFPIIAVIVLAGIVWLSRRLRSVAWGVALGLIAGGAVGNLGDRIFRAPAMFHGHVVDMISLFDEAGRVFPAGAIFNIADSALFCGVVLAIILEFTGRRRDGTREVRARKTPATLDQ
jgi:signal peptidase II